MTPVRAVLIAFFVTLIVFVLSGCSSFKLGAFCYVPYGQQGMCSAGSSPMPAADPSKPL